MRRGEICGLQWFDLNFERRLIHVRNTKNGKDRLIPMNATVRTLLGNQAKTSTYVFPSPRTKERLVEIKYSFVRAVKAARSRIYDFTISATQRRLAWETPARTRLLWLQSSAGQTFGWRCVTPTRWRTQSAGQLKQFRLGAKKMRARRLRSQFHVTTA